MKFIIVSFIIYLIFKTEYYCETVFLYLLDLIDDVVFYYYKLLVL
jgi:hypothetical protein